MSHDRNICVLLQACENGRGAILLSVARGKVSEGIDFGNSIMNKLIFCQYDRLCICLSVLPSICQSVSPSTCLSVSQSVSPSTCTCLFVCLFVCLSACLSVCLSVWLFFCPPGFYYFNLSNISLINFFNYDDIKMCLIPFLFSPQIIITAEQLSCSVFLMFIHKVGS